MKSGNNVNKALKEALQNYPVPLNESQWDRISGDLGKKKNKKPFFWLSIFSAVIVLISMLFYGLSDSNKSEFSQYLAQNQSQLQTEITTQTETDHPESNISNTESSQNQITERGELSESNVLPANSNTPNASQEQNKQSRDELENAKNTSSSINSTNNNRPTENQKDKQESNDLNQNNDRAMVFEPNNPSLIESPFSFQSVLNHYIMSYLLLKPEFAAPYEIQQKNENFDWFKANLAKNTSKASSNNSNDKPTKDSSKNSIAIGLMYGISMVNSKSNIDNQNSLHKDTREVFDAAAKNQTSNFLKVTLDIPLTKRFNLGLNSGFQYRYVAQEANYNYSYDSIPFRDVDNRVLFYLPNKDSSNLKINGRYKNVYQYLNIPLSFTYRLPLNSRNEFLLGAGMQFNMVLKNKGQLFDLNDEGFKDNSEFLKTTSNFGWMGSLEYSRQLQDHWWLGLGMGIQNQNLKFASENGYINNTLKFNSFHLHLRYKL
jgi:hypothetical protein